MSDSNLMNAIDSIARNAQIVEQASSKDMIVEPIAGDPFKSIPMVSREAQEKLKALNDEIENTIVDFDSTLKAKVETLLLLSSGFIIVPTLDVLTTIIPTADYNGAMLYNGDYYSWNTTDQDNKFWERTEVNIFDKTRNYVNEKLELIIDSSIDDITGYAFVVRDEENNIGLALHSDNSFEVAGASLQQTDKQSDMAWGVVDIDGSVTTAAMYDGSTIVAGNKHEQSSISGFVDDNGSVAMALVDGELRQPIIRSDQIYANKLTQKVMSCFEENGNIFIVSGGEIRQITTDGLNRNPIFSGDRIIFLSKKQRGTFKQYQYKDGLISRYYPNKDFSSYQQVIGTGQSLMLGVELTAIDHIPLDGMYKIGGYNVIARHDNPNKGDIELLSEGMYQTISVGFARKLNVTGILMSGCARGGTLYVDCKKGGQYRIFESCLEQVSLVHAKDPNSFVPAITVIHGEADGNISNPDYDRNLREWLDDFNTEIRKIKGYSSAVMLTCQTSSASGYKTPATRDQFTTPFLQLKASNTNPDIFLIGPKYQYQYKDYAHIQAIDTRHLGEMYAKVYRKVVIEGIDWKPLQPTSFKIEENKIVVEFHVPVQPLQFDNTYITSVENQGFELTNSGGITIVDVAITSPTQVTITCSGIVPNNAVLSYAFYNGNTNASSGRTSGSRGTLKDSDNQPDSYDYMPLNNWCVIFKQTLTP